jgi:hypothetical protein
MTSVVLRRFVQSGIIVLLALSAPIELTAQWMADSLLVSALKTRTGGGGGCGGYIDTTSISSPYFPGIHFLQADCILEHGDPYGAIVGTDSSGVLYFLGSREGLNFLLDRHPITGTLADSTRIDLAQFVLRLAGQIDQHAVRLDSLRQLPKPGLREFNSKALSARTESRIFGDSALPHILLLTSTLTYQDEVISSWDVSFIRKRPLYLEEWHSWVIPPIGRFAILRSGADSVLAGAARLAGQDYATLYAGALEKNRSSLGALFDLMPRLSDTAQVLHQDVLWNMWQRWRDSAFTRVLQGRSREVQTTVCTKLILSISSQYRKPNEFPNLARLARALGVDIDH